MSLQTLSAHFKFTDLRFLINPFWDAKLRYFTQGITNTVGAVPGIVGVALTGYLLDSTHSWSVSACFITLQLLYLYQ